MFFDERIRRARYFAIEIHGSQKYDIFPYIKHLEDVFLVLRRFGIDDINILISAFLHDAIEDGAASYNKLNKKFEKDIAELVFAVSDELGRNRKERHEKTLPKITGDVRKTVLKLADRIANLEFSMNKKAETSLFEMYKKEYFEFSTALRIKNMNGGDELKERLERMWHYLDSLFIKDR